MIFFSIGIPFDCNSTEYLQFVLIKINIGNRREFCYRAAWGLWSFFEGLMFGATTKKVGDPNVNYIGLKVFFLPHSVVFKQRNQKS